MTDTREAYIRAGKEYAAHLSVNHGNSEYVRDGYIHTNTLEGAFSLFDRMVVGTYHSISKKHLNLYCNEFTYRYNHRKQPLNMRFADAVAMLGKKTITYAELIGK